MKTSLPKLLWIVAGAGLVVAGVFLVGTKIRADGAEVGVQAKPVFAEKLGNVPGKSLTVVIVNYAPGGKIK